MATCDATHISNPASLVMNQTYTKMSNCFIILLPRLSENILLSKSLIMIQFSQTALFFLKNESSIKKAFNQSWRISNVPFWPKPNMPKSMLFWTFPGLAPFIILLTNLEWLWSYKNSWGSLHTKFIILEVKSRFTCVEPNLY